MSAMVLATSSRVMRNQSLRVAELGQSSTPSKIEPSEQLPSRMLAISPPQLLLEKDQPKVRLFHPQSEALRQVFIRQIYRSQLRKIMLMLKDY